MTHPKEGEWWCPGRFAGRTEIGDTYAGCDGDEKCDVCHGRSMAEALENRVSTTSWWDRQKNTYQGMMLRGWANLVASRYGRPVYLVGGALKDAWVRDVDVRVILSKSEFEARFGLLKDERYASRCTTDFESMDAERRWHVEMAKMNKQGAGNTHCPIDFQCQSIREGVGYINEFKQRLDDIPGLKPPWED
jgi:hypothetical protein